MQPRISVLIPAFNEERHLPETLASIHASFHAAGESGYEIVVCDNNSTDRTPAVAQEGGASVVFEPHNQIARARNTAAERARGEWLIFIDADSHLNPALLRETLRCFHSGTVCAGGATVRMGANESGRRGTLLLWLWNTVSVRLRLAAGSYIFCYRQAWEEVGGFDQTVYAGEELFFSRKLKRWARKHRLRFRILADAPITTSARKLDWYGPWELLRHVLALARPGALRQRDNCALWYERPKL